MRGGVVKKPGGKIPPNPGGIGGQVCAGAGAACCRAWERRRKAIYANGQEEN